jgi:hypothetical protein
MRTLPQKAVPSFVDGLPVPGGLIDEHLGQPGLTVFQPVKHPEILANRFLFGVSFYLFRALIPVADHALAVEHENGIVFYLPDHQVVLLLFMKGNIVFSIRTVIRHSTIATTRVP